MIDCDGHILEPPDLWEKYLEPATATGRSASAWATTASSTWRSTAGAPHSPGRGQLGTLGGMGKRVDEARALRERAMRGEVAPEEVRGIRPGPEQTYLRGAAFGTMDMKERVQLLDREGLAKAVLYPTLGPPVGGRADRPRALERVLPRVQPLDRRLLPRLRRAAGPHRASLAGRSRRGGRASSSARSKDGCRGAFVCPFTITRVPHGDPRHDAVFAAAQDLDVPLAIHPTFEPLAWDVHHRFDKFGWAVWYFNLFAGQGVQQAFATFFQLGVFERFPRLRVVRARVPGGLDRLLPRSRRRDLRRHPARRHRAPDGEAVVLLQAPVLHLGRSGRAHDRRR